MALNVKARARLIGRGYMIFGVALIAWTALGRPLDLKLEHVPHGTWLTTAATTVLSVLVAAIESIPGPNAKAALVFWRLSHPLPGSRAFEKANLEKETRINRDRLREAVGGKLPRSAADQNSTWYGLYKKLQADPSVKAVHGDYLAFRDLAWFSLVLTGIAIANRIFVSQAMLGYIAVAYVALYLLFRTAGAERGWRFVNQVLVLASATDDQQKQGGEE